MKYVFETTNLPRYAFPTHVNDLVIDRADASASEVFVVIVEPGKAVHLHAHVDAEQIYYVLEGEGVLTVGEDKSEFALKKTDVVRIPPKTLHTVRATGGTPVRYLCIDCFGGKKKSGEPTWDAHVEAICRQQGYDFKDVVATQKNRHS